MNKEEREKEGEWVVLYCDKERKVMEARFLSFSHYTPPFLVLYSSSLCSLFKSRATFLSACIWTKHKEEEEEWRLQKTKGKWKGKWGTSARLSFSFVLSSFPTQRKETSEQSKTRAHLFPLVFALYTCPFLSLVYFPFIEKEQRRAFFALCLSSIKGKGNKEEKAKWNEKKVSVTHASFPFTLPFSPSFFFAFKLKGVRSLTLLI